MVLWLIIIRDIKVLYCNIAFEGNGQIVLCSSIVSLLLKIKVTKNGNYNFSFNNQKLLKVKLLIRLLHTLSSTVHESPQLQTTTLGPTWTVQARAEWLLPTVGLITKKYNNDNDSIDKVMMMNNISQSVR